MLAYHAMMLTTSEGTDKSFADLLSRLKSSETPPAELNPVQRSTTAPMPFVGIKSRLPSDSWGLAQDLPSVVTNPGHPPRGGGISPMGGVRRDAPPVVLNAFDRALVLELRAEIEQWPSARDSEDTAREGRAGMHKWSSAPGKGLSHSEQNVQRAHEQRR